MKNLIAAALMLGFATFASAQAPTATAPANTTTTTTTTTAPAAPKMVKKHRMGHKSAAISATTGTGTVATGAATTGTTAPAQNKMKHSEGQHHSKRTLAEQQAAAAKSAARDKVVSKDAEGHDIHLGPNGGQYYINKEGTKTYLKGTAKLKVN